LIKFLENAKYSWSNCWLAVWSPPKFDFCLSDFFSHFRPPCRQIRSSSRDHDLHFIAGKFHPFRSLF